MARRTFKLTIDTLGRPPLANARQHWSARARMTDLWRSTAAWTARASRIPPLAAADLRCWARYPSRRSLPDPDGLAPAVKAALDGLVDARVLADDSFPSVRSVTYLPPEVVPGLPAALVVEVVEVESDQRLPSPVTAEMRRDLGL